MNPKRRESAFALCLLAYFTIGSMVLTANTVMDSIITEYAWTDSRGALLITCMSTGYLLMSIFGNLLMDRLGRRRTLLFFAALIAASFALFALAPVPELFYLFLLLSGFCWGSVNNLTNTVVSELYDGSVSRLNIMHAGYSVGAVVFPLLVGFMVRSGLGWRAPVLLVAALGLALFVCAWLVRLPERGVGASARETEQFSFWKEAGFYISTMTLFLYVGVETAASSWISGYLQRYNAFFERIPAQTMVSLMWGMILVGRLIIAAISTRLDKRKLLVALTSCFLAGMVGLVAFCRSTPLIIVSVVVMGLGMSALYGTTIANAQRYVSGPALGAGIMYSAGGFGSAIVPYAAGLVSDWKGLRLGMASLCAFLAMLVVMTLLGWRNAKKSERGA